MKTDVPILKRLGPVPYWRGQDRCLDSLRRIYERAMEDAGRKLGSCERETPASTRKPRVAP